MAFDYGRRRIGVAFANPATDLATPLTTLTARDGEPAWNEVDALIDEWRPQILVAGVPYNVDGSESPLTAQAEAFAARLRERYGLPVDCIDERWTSMEAGDTLKQARRAGLRKRRVRREDIDAEAAGLIAQSWLRSARDENEP